jgi:4-amino-4-deoxy-L-arabinose transferase-like glycosyltransferase
MAELANPIALPEHATETLVAARSDSRAWLYVRAWPIARQVILVLSVVFVAKQVLNVFVFPPFTGHDEVAHYAYIRTVASDHRIPILPDVAGWVASGKSSARPDGDYLPDDLYKYCHFALGWDGRNVCEIDKPSFVANPPHSANYSQGVGLQPVGYQYAANHPPLYYILMTPVYWLTESGTPETQLYALRAAVIPFGLLTVLFAYLMTRTLFPGDTFLSITVPAFVAFQPQVSYEAAMVNNDIVCIALFSCVLYLIVRGIRDRFSNKLCVITGFVFGLALLSKGTSMIAAPLIALAIILGVGVHQPKRWIVKGAITAAMAGLIAWPWYLFLYHTYGNLTAFSQVEDLQWFNYWSPTGPKRPSFLDLFWNKDFAVLRWKETWGMFGWRRLPLDDWLLWSIAVPLIAALVGFIVYAIVAGRSRWQWVVRDRVMMPTRWQSYALLTLFVTCVVAYLAIIQFGLQFALTQARYYFPAINAVALILMLGLRTLLPVDWRRYGQATVLAALVLMNIIIYTQYVVPYRLEGWV